ncbi:MAG: ATP-binding cassette domain-containing protein [Symbiobacteriaceae bacterium]|nr:ATP-binding cassette domain-containing protein [Symbiobacteriaceae bacterium]
MATPAATLLEVRRLTKSYPVAKAVWQRRRGRFYALKDINFHIAAGETLGLIGESGSGKSTLAKIIARLLLPDSGEVFLQGQEILKLSPHAFSGMRRSIQMIFQDPNSSLNPRFTINETLAEPLIGFRLGNARERQERILRMLPVVGLEESVLQRYPHQLSGGQKQRVAILGVLLVEPALIIADEIISSLDLSVQAQILNLWRDLQRRYNLSTLFISHDLQVVAWLADRVMVMYAGQIVEAGSTEEICLNPTHPYTQLLFRSEEAGVALQPEAVSGYVTDLSPATTPQCHFYHRCPWRQRLCFTTAPEQVILRSDHWLRCHLPNVPKSPLPSGVGI